MKCYFRCPDGERQPIAACIDGNCRMKERCAPLTYLKACGEQRPWSGKPSVTQLLNGTRASYLSLTTDFAVSPDDLAFQTIGSGAHLRMQSRGGDDSEVGIEFEGITGIFDFVEKWEGETVLWDYKTSGSYAVARAIGMTAQKEALLDENGQQMMWRGKARTTTTFSVDRDQRDLKDWALQLNFYRVAHERKQNIKIDRMFIFSVVRDGGTVVAKQRGVEKNTYMIDVPMMDDDGVILYFVHKRDALLDALEKGKVPGECTREEAWDGRRCKGYCAVAEACARIGCSYMKGGEDATDA